MTIPLRHLSVAEAATLPKHAVREAKG